MEARPYKILVGATGSVASVKIPSLLETLKTSFEPPPELKLVATSHAFHFFNREKVPTGVEILTDEDEWKTWTKMGDPVLHIDLRNWADIIIIAPLDANSLAKVAGGLCDNLLTCVMRAWDTSKPVLVCPAMNTHMWNHPFTSKHMHTLSKDLGYKVEDPISKTLACGDTGSPFMSIRFDV
ncbi:putative phosphopantothenoylcysteine decarboxylase [Chytridium lagenaria]|nr:putative phosphopantothenoylcysteine decarboxylase [Chytridium lagenaria]